MIDLVRGRRERERRNVSEAVRTPSTAPSKRLCIPPSDSEEDDESDDQVGQNSPGVGGDKVWGRLYIAPEAEGDFREFIKAHPGSVELVLN